MVNKKDESNPAPETVIPELKDEVSIEDTTIPEKLNMSKYDFDESGSEYLWDDYQIGEKIDHIDGMTVEEADHMTATRLYQNTAKVHFNEHTEKEGRLGKTQEMIAWPSDLKRWLVEDNVKGEGKKSDEEVQEKQLRKI